MPHIEVLPNSSSISAPGWAYVPDTGYDPSKAAIQPSGARKRAARNVAAEGAHTSARHNTVLKHLADLDRDNHRDVQINVPVKHRDAAGRVSKGKVTPAVRRILMSQKTFANHLADEEALLSNQPATPVTATRATPMGKAGKPPSSLAQRASTSSSTTTPILSTAPADTTSQSEATSRYTPMAISANVPSGFPAFSSADDVNPLLRSYMPSPPSPETIETLLSAPPLSYTAARAAPLSSNIPHRKFCEICGYWGRVRCMKCGARVCGLECKGVHDDGRCLKFYA